MKEYIVTVESSQWCGCSETEMFEAETLEDAEDLAYEWAREVMAFQLTITENT